MENRIETLEPTLICGKSLKMSFQNDRTFELWQSFMPLLKNVSRGRDDPNAEEEIWIPIRKKSQRV